MQIQVDFELLSLPDHLDIEINNIKADAELPCDYALRLATEKNHQARKHCPGHHFILTADTVVALGNVILGKPKSLPDAQNILSCLSGKTHEVITAVVVSTPQKELKSCIARTEVTFNHLTKDEIDRYLTVNNVMDKAGSYAIQEYAALFISHISGSYSNVVGLPLFETGQLLKTLGILAV